MKRTARHLVNIGLVLALVNVSATTPALAQEEDSGQEICSFWQKLENYWNTGGREWDCG